jgi:hypothetical protein
MKKLLLILGCCFVGWTIQSQTIVSTDPANKNVIIEEFTGACCGYCPDAHRIVNEIMASNPGRAWGINIHAGDFSNGVGCEQRFRSNDGTTIHDHFYSKNGYPTGMVNRGGMQQRTYWKSTTATRLAESSYLNVAAKGDVDWDTRTLTLLVEVYYTGNSSASENFLTVALLQNNILGGQSGASSNPSQALVDGQYNHMHMLRDIISPVWGDTIKTTTQGTFYEKTYTYSIPEAVNAVDVLLGDIEILAYVSETKSTVISGTKAVLTDVNKPALPAIDADILALAKTVYIGDCDNFSEIRFNLKNEGADTIKSIKYNVKNGTQVLLQDQIWNRRGIITGVIDTLIIRNIPSPNNTTQNITIEITEINEISFPIASESLQILKNVVEDAQGNMTLKIVTDQYASYTYYYVYNPTGSIISTNVSSSGQITWTNLSSIGTTERLMSLSLPVGCYLIAIADQYGQGINKGYGAGYVELLDKDNTRLFYNDGKFGSELLFYVDVTSPAPVSDITASSNITVFPNPANDRITILSDNAEIQRVELYNIQGQLIKNQQLNDNTMNISDLSAGMYSVRIITEKGVAVKNIIKK